MFTERLRRKKLKREFFTYLANVLGAFSVVEAVRGYMVVSEEARRVCEVILREMERRRTFTEAVQRAFGTLSHHEVMMLMAGEKTGDLATAVRKMMELEAKEREEKRKAIVALIQPVGALFFVVLLIFVTVFFTLPKLRPLVDALPPEKVPRFTAFVFAAGDWLRERFWCGAGAFLAVTVYVLKNAELLFEMPVVRSLQRLRLQYLFFDMLLTYGEAGYTLTEALDVMAAQELRRGRRTMFGHAVTRIRQRLQARGDLVEAMKRTGLFDDEALVFMTAAVRGGMSVDTLRMASNVYRARFYAEIEKAKNLLAPVAIVLTAGVMFIVFAAIWIPLMQISSSLG
ncbi:type II secretion system F family protein [Thermosulfurimonas sp. F29]|uniref:type II secretion system F family protein n=1 Tax=Thermosulfurimonas sp. F29 TaxID=2867247 RepID=UPI001C83C418|nr:type II secretion system F family protein [Thermosulfurimonas sp. F29]MBX6423410.1 type II secretion system F family protein [Thermosulfurimonas sp. F29]